MSGIVKEVVDKRRELGEKKEVLEFLGVVLQLYGKLGVIGEDVKRGRVVEAAEGLRELKEAIGVSASGDSGVPVEGEPVVCGILRKQWNDCFEEVI